MPVAGLLLEADEIDAEKAKQILQNHNYHLAELARLNEDIDECRQLRDLAARVSSPLLANLLIDVDKRVAQELLNALRAREQFLAVHPEVSLLAVYFDQHPQVPQCV